MGYILAVLFPLMAAGCVWIVVHPDDYPGVATTVAALGIATQMLGAVVSLWRVVLRPEHAALASTAVAPCDPASAEGRYDPSISQAERS